MTRISRGFTAIEAAIALAGVIFATSVALPAYQTYRLSEQVSDLIEDVAAAKLTVEDYARSKHELPTTDAIAMPFVSSKRILSTSWASSGNVGTITIATPASHVGQPAELSSKAIVLTARFDRASEKIEWRCGDSSATTIDAKYLPTSCK